MAACILNICSDSTLRDTRHRLLSNAGFSVLSVSSPQAALSMLTAKSCDAVILCDPITSDGRDAVAREAKGLGLAVMFIQAIPEHPRHTEADVIIPKLSEPQSFLAAVMETVEAKKRQQT